MKDMIDKRKPDVIVVSAESRYASYYLIMSIFYYEVSKSTGVFLVRDGAGSKWPPVRKV